MTVAKRWLSSSSYVYAFCAIATLLYIFFDVLGSYFALLLSLTISKLSPRQPTIDLKQLKVHYHASWIIPLGITVLGILLSGVFDKLGFPRILLKFVQISSAWDVVYNAMLSNSNTSSILYPEVFFQNTWRKFYTAVQVGLLCGAVCYGYSLSVLTTHSIVPDLGSGTSNIWYLIFGSVIFLLSMSLALQFFEFSVLPGKRGLFSKAFPFLNLAITWPTMLCLSVLSHAIITKIRGAK